MSEFLSESIQTRVADFLKLHPPFSYLPENILRELALSVEIRFFEDGATIYSGETSSDITEIYIIQQGSVKLTGSPGDADDLVDICDEGDVFGGSVIKSDTSLKFTATASEQTLVYVLPVMTLFPLLEEYPRLALYFEAGFTAGHHERKAVASNEALKTLSNTKNDLLALKEEEILTLPVGKDVLTCLPETAIRQAAIMMTERSVGSIIIVNENNHPVGIITDTDLRKKVATGEVTIDARVEEVMSSPVMTIPANTTVASLILRMIRKNIRHLCVTEDGSDQSSIIGMVSEHDLLLLHSDNPAVLVKEINQTSDPDRLRVIRDRAHEMMKRYLEHGVAIGFIAEVITEINDALIRRSIRIVTKKLREAGIVEPDVPWTWLSLGSEGRSEQLLRTDLDNAILFGDVDDNRLDETRNYFLRLAGDVNEILINCGFQKCPADIMAGNPKWCLSKKEWKKIYHSWIATPEPGALMNSTIFFDFRSVFGDSDLAESIKDHIFEEMNRQNLFIHLLASNALQNPPPLSFFRSFIVERSGEHKNQFDIKARAMMPVSDAARVLAYDMKLQGVTGTFERLKAIAMADKNKKDLMEDAAAVYSTFMEIRTRNGISHEDSGRFINATNLSRLDRQILKNSFSIIDELQTVLRIRFQLDSLRI